jgi:alpha-galactosidase
MYSCAGTRTCAGYPGSFDHEFQDARNFASWGVDFLKYDFCYFPAFANCRHRYLIMAQALRSTGRDILFSACNWGVEEPWSWMRSIGAHMYRSTGDIVDSFASTAHIMNSQMNNFNANASGCFNDMDMLTIGMAGQGFVGREDCNNYREYETQFAFWCFCAAPLMMGADLRKVSDEYRTMLQH